MHLKLNRRTKEQFIEGKKDLLPDNRNLIQKYYVSFLRKNTIFEKKSWLEFIDVAWDATNLPENLHLDLNNEKLSIPGYIKHNKTNFVMFGYKNHFPC